LWLLLCACWDPRSGTPSAPSATPYPTSSFEHKKPRRETGLLYLRIG
jgi:hypothetical protein